MADTSIIIIGAGLAGLATGCYAQMNGYQSHIFEHHAVPGGVAASWKRKGYLIDGGIHFVMGHKPGTALHDLYRQLGVVQDDFCVDMTSYGRFVDEASGAALEVTPDLARLARDMKALSPTDARWIDPVIAGAQAMRGFDMSELGMGDPPELMNPLRMLKEVWGMRHLMKLFVGRYAKSVADYARAFQDSRLQDCLESLFLPEVPVFFICMVLALLADGQLGMLKKGCLHGFVLPMEKRYRALGGLVTTRATVKEILVEDDRAVGVRLADGSEHRADIVISAADGTSTVFDMLGGKYVNRRLERLYERLTLCRPMVTVSYGVADTFPDVPLFLNLVLARPVPIGDHAVDQLIVRTLNYSPYFAPSGKTVVQSSFDASWAYWSDLHQTDRARYDAEKQRVADEILKRLDAYFPGIATHVEVTDIATPYTTWRYTLNREGSWGGWLMTPRAFMTRIPRTLPGLKNFYMAGQWVMPGGGVPSALYSGRHVIQILCRQDRKPFNVI